MVITRQGLENRLSARARGFESHPLRLKKETDPKDLSLLLLPGIFLAVSRKVFYNLIIKMSGRKDVIPQQKDYRKREQRKREKDYEKEDEKTTFSGRRDDDSPLPVAGITGCEKKPDAEEVITESITAQLESIKTLDEETLKGTVCR